MSQAEASPLEDGIIFPGYQRPFCSQGLEAQGKTTEAKKSVLGAHD